MRDKEIPGLSQLPNLSQSYCYTPLDDCKSSNYKQEKMGKTTKVQQRLRL